METGRCYPAYLLRNILWVLALSFALLSSARAADTSLEKSIAADITRTPEFAFIRQEAERLGVRVYLFGGSAASYAHYVKWDELQKAGDHRFQPNRFDFDYTNIFRSTQDADLVVDGPAEKAQELQALLEQKFEHFQGNKTAWEVRLLKDAMKDKLPLLHDPDFLGQHSDSHSTGLIELTNPPAGEKVVKDLRDWNSADSQFLRDVRESKLHFYFSEMHSATTRAKNGINPPIFAAIRYLTKAFQFELEMRPEDLEKIKKIVQDFSPEDAAKNSYVTNWIEKNGKKLLQNAVNVEFAQKKLADLGLTPKLAALSGNKDTVDSLAWWLGKKALPSRPLGTKGKTARELGLDVVAHDTRDFEIHEAITRAHTGEPNVFVSQEGYVGEAAKFGEGFYTRKGDKGAYENGITIKFHLNPEARLGIDFDLPKGTDYVRILNKKALRVIPESLALTPLQYFQLLRDGGLDSQNRAVIEKVRRRVKNQVPLLSEKQYGEIGEIVHTEMAKEKPNWILVEEWLHLPRSQTHEIGVWQAIDNKYASMKEALAGFGRIMRNEPEQSKRLLPLLAQYAHIESADAFLNIVSQDSDIFKSPQAFTRFLSLHPTDRDLERAVDFFRVSSEQKNAVLQMQPYIKSPKGYFGILRHLFFARKDEEALELGDLLVKTAPTFNRFSPTRAELEDYAELFPTEASWQKVKAESKHFALTVNHNIMPSHSLVSAEVVSRLKEVTEHFRTHPWGLTGAEIPILKDVFRTFAGDRSPADLLALFSTHKYFNSIYTDSLQPQFAQVAPMIIEEFKKLKAGAGEWVDLRNELSKEPISVKAINEYGMANAVDAKEFLRFAADDSIYDDDAEFLGHLPEAKLMGRYASLTSSEHDLKYLLKSYERFPLYHAEVEKAFSQTGKACPSLFRRLGSILPKRQRP